eukprot:4057061-Pleurochrysis_carterae.AAC.1
MRKHRLSTIILCRSFLRGVPCQMPSAVWKMSYFDVAGRESQYLHLIFDAFREFLRDMRALMRDVRAFCLICEFFWNDVREFCLACSAALEELLLEVMVKAERPELQADCSRSRLCMLDC